MCQLGAGVACISLVKKKAYFENETEMDYANHHLQTTLETISQEGVKSPSAITELPDRALTCSQSPRTDLVDPLWGHLPW